MHLSKAEIYKLLEEKKLVISPLLELDQIGELTIDFRLGYNFLVTIQGGNPFIDASLNNDDRFPISESFQETRRLIGETFLLHPNQTILEYVKLPNDVLAILTLRSSYLRLGISLSAIVQPGYCGCISLELTNANKVPINLTVGAPILQARLQRLSQPHNYFSKPRKYVCQVRPIVSSATEDSDLKILKKIWLRNNHKGATP
jgi:dCTP deaminase